MSDATKEQREANARAAETLDWLIAKLLELAEVQGDGILADDIYDLTLPAERMQKGEIAVPDEHEAVGSSS